MQKAAEKLRLYEDSESIAAAGDVPYTVYVYIKAHVLSDVFQQGYKNQRAVGHIVCCLQGDAIQLC